MVKQLLCTWVTIVFYYTLSAQGKEQKIVFDFVKPDTKDFRIMVAQINNTLKEETHTRIEVICSDPGLFFLVSDKTRLLPFC